MGSGSVLMDICEPKPIEGFLNALVCHLSDRSLSLPGFEIWPASTQRGWGLPDIGKEKSASSRR
jgi:hypothetical protein